MFLLTRIVVRIIIKIVEGGIVMLEVIIDVVKSKTMIGVMVFILGISYISACQNQSLDSKYTNSILIEEAI
jgi:uncharacterized membrane protein HdeD (DUF308 family)